MLAAAGNDGELLLYQMKPCFYNKAVLSSIATIILLSRFGASQIKNFCSYQLNDVTTELTRKSPRLRHFTLDNLNTQVMK
jgi:hypothetical protein